MGTKPIRKTTTGKYIKSLFLWGHFVQLIRIQYKTEPRRQYLMQKKSYIEICHKLNEASPIMIITKFESTALHPNTDNVLIPAPIEIVPTLVVLP